MSHNGTFRAVSDGLIRGEVLTNKTACSKCGTATVVIHVHEITLPAGIKPGVQLLGYVRRGLVAGAVTHRDFLGIGCGCYAKFHRQIVHIKDQHAPSEGKVPRR